MNDLSEKSFALEINDSSMEPQFYKGVILIFDPEKNIYDRCYVLVKLKTELFVFRQLVIDAEHKFIKPLHPDLIRTQMKLLNKSEEIIAILVEARQTFF